MIKGGRNMWSIIWGPKWAKTICSPKDTEDLVGGFHCDIVCFRPGMPAGKRTRWRMYFVSSSWSNTNDRVRNQHSSRNPCVGVYVAGVLRFTVGLHHSTRVRAHAHGYVLRPCRIQFFPREQRAVLEHFNHAPPSRRLVSRERLRTQDRGNGVKSMYSSSPC